MPWPHCSAFTAPRANTDLSLATCASSMRSPAPAKITLCSPTTLPPRSVAKPMSPRLRGPGDAVASLDGALREIDRAPFGGGGPEHQRGAGRRIDLVAVVHLDDLDVEVLIQRLGDASRQRHEQVDAEAHVAGLDDGSVARRRGDLRFVGSG